MLETIGCQKNTVNKSIFPVKERKELIELGLEIADNEIYSSIDEKFLVYSNLSIPTDKLYISYSNSSLSGQPLEVSYFVNDIIEFLNPCIFTEPSEKLDFNTLPETQKAAFCCFDSFVLLVLSSHFGKRFFRARYRESQ